MQDTQRLIAELDQINRRYKAKTTTPEDCERRKVIKQELKRLKDAGKLDQRVPTGLVSR